MIKIPCKAMAAKEWGEAQLKSMIKDVIKQELKDVNQTMEDIKKEHKKLTDEARVKEIVRETMINMYKYLWQKSGTYIRQI